jgi:RimJ/RimL family protein N-acetyltransferase
VLDSFTTARLRAERLTAEHLPELRRMHADPVVMEHLRGIRDEQDTIAYLTRNLQHWQDYGYGLWMLRELGGGPPVGRTVLRHLMVDEVDEVEVGYAFYQEYWGRGYASEIAAACLAIGREQLHLKTIVAVTSLTNTASQHVLRKVGLAYERDITNDGKLVALFRTTA